MIAYLKQIYKLLLSIADIREIYVTLFTNFRINYKLFTKWCGTHPPPPYLFPSLSLARHARRVQRIPASQLGPPPGHHRRCSFRPGAAAPLSFPTSAPARRRASSSTPRGGPSRSAPRLLVGCAPLLAVRARIGWPKNWLLGEAKSTGRGFAILNNKLNRQYISRVYTCSTVFMKVASAWQYPHMSDIDV
jgi:hypothetical protein